MPETRMDGFDIAILDALQRDGAMTNAALAELVNLSASQCSRRRAALEEAGVIEGYAARLNPQKLGFGLRAIIRVNLRSHGQGKEDDFARFVAAHPQIRSAFSVSGDADYILDVRLRDLEAFSDFIHRHLLPQPQVAQVRSEIVLRTLKDDRSLVLP
ncbi:DNA-binding Lrp family transcriptional regulator [Paracoccus pantotrophus]|uniref:DNA-binding Lrp family transcriptional regulator n=2 Tax=Paracoccaceae TaxID=31989 RepID=A0A1I5C0M3_PARPN|nr:Lrp/AsnC family transcriptional regulator [Paracoccus pantotrophus]QFG35581.1 Lrp/AsnC family transcriptional regulator [Paracoccus pantotrophus]QLH13852.1 Lrp/AsnC family transcriptional regulator [Paracoccus pantotrophus]RDE01056.1 Lrp/AsnC family transcriptional regulator [Paracoccus pantotrophus]RKS44184.1 DNA-binding Lrp family transcriptional regulator [Paracoccus pantotrophus]RNI17528.1 Lrp/AsnC family transcriptional regulator [Paracoccus pantotrophus]